MPIVQSTAAGPDPYHPRRAPTPRSGSSVRSPFHSGRLKYLLQATFGR